MTRIGRIASVLEITGSMSEVVALALGADISGEKAATHIDVPDVSRSSGTFSF